MATVQRIFNLLFILTLCLALYGGFLYQVINNDQPCPLCLLQRLSMIGMASALLMNLRFGIKPEHYGLAIICALSGLVVCLRQICLHLCPDFPPYGREVFGLSLYIWAFIIFMASILACGVLLILYSYSKDRSYPSTWGIPEKIAFGLVVFIAFSNMANTFIRCGLTPCS